MKYKSSILVGIVVAFLMSALAQSPSLPPHIWGAATNGLCGGIQVRPSDRPSHKGDFYCDIDVRNITTNSLYIRIPPLERRYEIELRGPDGRQIRQLKPISSSQKQPWLGREPFNLDSYSERRNIDWFFLKETFDVRTNGLHTLIVSVRVNAFTNFIAGQYKMNSHPTYFLLPPVTNTFNLK